MGRKHKNTTAITPEELAAVRAAFTMPVDYVDPSDVRAIAPNPITYKGIPLEFIPPWPNSTEGQTDTQGTGEQTREQPGDNEPTNAQNATNAHNATAQNAHNATAQNAHNATAGDTASAAMVTPNIFGRGTNGRFEPKPPAPPKPEAKRPTSAVLGSESGSRPGNDVSGLYALPPSWPTLVNNASLQSELGWVQAERLRIVEERGNRTVVRLERASSPPPSMAALGWLETSIRSYAKYIDIVAKSLSSAVDDQESTRRERLRLDEIKALLREMCSDEQGRR